MIKVLKSGIQTTIQGNRRSGFLSLGFPASGPMDSLSMMGANYLVGNKPFDTVFEMYIKGPDIEFETDMQIAICGADMKPAVNGKQISNYEVNNGEENVLLICIYQDREGAIWLGTNNDGVYKLNGTSFEKFEPEVIKETVIRD